MLVAFIVKIGMLLTVALRCTGACGEQEPPHNSTRSPSSDTNIENFVRDLKENYLEMDVLPDEDWPPSIGRHESNLVMIEHGRNTLPGAKEAEEMQRNYVKGNVDDIKNKRKEITYNELFSFLKEKSKSKFRMLIDGAPGVGKTTLCRKFCKDWGAGKILKQFSFVWLLNMREERIAKAKSLDDLFQHYDKDLLREVVQLIKKTGGEGNLLVCDGFDELSEDKRTRCSLFLDIIRGKELPKCSVIVSSRPYASQMLQQMNRITHHVEIVGFTEKQIKECIRKNITDKPKAEELIEQLKQRLDTLSLCYRPLSAAIMIYVYKQEEYTLPTTLTQLYTLYALHSLKRSVTIHFENLRSDDITDLKKLPDPIALPFKALCKMAYNGLHDDQLGFSTSQLPQSLQGCPECKGTKPYLLGFMSGSKSFTGSNPELSYHFTHLTVQEFLAAWYAATELSGEEQTKLFIEKAGDDRFRMMLLFLAGITGLQDTKAYQQIVHHMHFQQLVPKQQNPQTLEDIMEKEEKEEISMLDLIFLSHLIYESQNVSLSPILANSVQQDGKLSLMFDLCNQLECTVVAYFLSTNNFPWKKLELVGLYDDNMDIIYGMCCEHATNPDDSTSDTEVANPPPFLNNAQEVGLQYTFHKQTSSQNLLRFRNLLNVKLVVLTVTFSSVSAQVWHYWSTFLCDKITRHATLKRLDVVIEECSNECEVLQKILKTNSSLQYFKIACSKSCLSDLVVGIFRALVSNTTLEALDMSHSTLQSSPNSSSLPTSSSNTSSHVDAAMAHMLTNNSTLTRLDVSFCGLNPESSMSIFKALKCNSSLETLYMNMNNAFHQAASEALADMLSCNRSLTKLSIIGYEYGCTAHRSRPNLARAIARGLLRNTTLTSVRVWDIEKQSIMEALVDLRKDEGHTRQTDPEVARCDQVLQRYTLNFVCESVYTCQGFHIQ